MPETITGVCAPLSGPPTPQQLCYHILRLFAARARGGAEPAPIHLHVGARPCTAKDKRGKALPSPQEQTSRDMRATWPKHCVWLGALIYKRPQTAHDNKIMRLSHLYWVERFPFAMTRSRKVDSSSAVCYYSRLWKRGRKSRGRARFCSV